MATRKKRALTPEEQLEAALVPKSEWPYEVPNNWCWVRIGSINSYKSSSVDPRKTPDSLFELYSVPSLEEGYPEIVAGSDIGSTKQAVEKGDVLLCKINPRINRVWKVDKHTDETLIASSEWVVIRSATYDPEFLMRCLSAHFFREQLLSHVSGVGGSLMRAQPRYIKDYVIPLPPLHEQRRIASRIEWLFAKLDDAEAELRKVIASSEQRQVAILHSAFSGELTKTWRVVNGLGAGLESWRPTTSDELFEYVTSGSRGWAKYYSDTGAVFLRMGNLDHGTIELDLSDIQHVELPDRAEGQRSLVRKDDILISITADVGMIGFVRNIDYEAYINQHVALARPTQPKSAEFIAWYLVSDVGFVQLRQKQRGATKVGLGLDDIRSLTLLMPTASEQELILETINSCMDNEARMVEAAEKATGSIHKTRQSILNRALHGELGTNDLGEPSSKDLLANIMSGNAGK